MCVIEPQAPEVIVEVSGGMVQAVYSNVVNLQVKVLDYDNWSATPDTDKEELKCFIELSKRTTELKAVY